MNKEYRKLSKNALICMYVASGILDFMIVGIVIFVWRVFFAKDTWAMVAAIILLALCIVGFLISPYIRFQRYRYCIDEECIDIKEGLVFVKRDIVPIERLHKIAVIRGPIDTMLGLGKVSVSTAGGDVVIRFLEIEQADAIAESLKNRINQIAVEGRTDV